MPLVTCGVESKDTLSSAALTRNALKLPTWAKTGGKKKFPAHEELWTWVWLCKPRRASTTISSVLIWRQKCANMVEMHTDPGPASELHQLDKSSFQLVFFLRFLYAELRCTVNGHAVPGFGYRARLAGQTGSRMRLTHLRPLALPPRSSLSLTLWLRIIADRGGEWELDTAAATSSLKPSWADIFLLRCEAKWEKTNIHNQRNNKLSLGACGKGGLSRFLP